MKKESLDDIYSSLIEAHGNNLYKFCLKLAYSREDADDLFSEVILKVFEYPSKILEKEHPERLLFTTASYLFKSSQRKYARRMRLVPVVPIENNHIKDDVNIQDEVIKADIHKMLNHLINGLPEKFKIPLIFYYTLEMNVSEIAQTLKIPNGTVMSRLKRGRERVKKELMEAGYDEK